MLSLLICNILIFNTAFSYVVVIVTFLVFRFVHHKIYKILMVLFFQEVNRQPWD